MLTPLRCIRSLVLIFWTLSSISSSISSRSSLTGSNGKILVHQVSAKKPTPKTARSAASVTTKSISNNKNRFTTTAAAAAATAKTATITNPTSISDSPPLSPKSVDTTDSSAGANNNDEVIGVDHIISTTMDSDGSGSSGGPSTSAAAALNTKGGSGGGGGGLPDGMKLLIGAGGIYGAFLYYGSLQEDVFRFVSPVDGSSFKQAWFLQVLEALANVIVGFVGMHLTKPTKGIPLRMFGISGAAQVSAKACTSLALANGLSFPVATLAKSGKMAPVMAGSLLLGGATYTVREYLQVAAIIGGTAIVSLGKKKGSSGGDSSMMGVCYIVLSLVLDGVTAGFQKRLKMETAKVGVKPKPYDFMFWTNLFMFLTAVVIAGVLGEISSGGSFLMSNPEITAKILRFAVCSAVGQSFIFYTIANFDPLVLSTVTTTRKIFSVLLSIFLKGHSLSVMGWSGIMLAVSGILSELQAKAGGGNKKSKSHSK